MDKINSGEGLCFSSYIIALQNVTFEAKGSYFFRKLFHAKTGWWTAMYSKNIFKKQKTVSNSNGQGVSLLLSMKMRMIPKWNQALWCYHSNESYWAVLSCGTVYYAVQGGSNFWVCGWNLKVLPFKWKLLGSTFLWYCLLCCTRWF